MIKKIAIIDYGMGNLYSVRNSFMSLGVEADIIETPGKIFSYDKLILPGVGAFGDAMKELKRKDFIAPIKDFIAICKPFLGICLGMQLLMDKSDESKGSKGLGIIAGDVKKFSSKLKCPHMGWNKINPSTSRSEDRDLLRIDTEGGATFPRPKGRGLSAAECIKKCSPRLDIFKGIRGDIYTYFCHSYFVKPKDKSAVIGETEYGIKFASMIKQGNVYGMQFHPEKSQETGLKLLQNFIQLC